jgi:hypothetical protein
MTTVRRGTNVPARWRLFVCGHALLASSSIAARADEGIVDVHALPRLDGAVEDTSRPDPYRVQYGVPTVVAVTRAATEKLLAADGWVSYLLPLEENNTRLNFKKGRQGLSASFTQALGRPDQSVVSYTPDRIYSNVPFPDGASDIMFDGTRPYLGCVAPATVEAVADFYAREMTAIGWRKLTPESAARWPNAELNEAVPNGVRAFYGHDDDEARGFYRQKPVMLTLTRRDDGKTNVDVRVAPFAVPGELKADQDMAGLPRPTPTKTASGKGSAGSNKRELTAAALAELPAVLAFYHRELAARGWQEDGNAPLSPGDEVAIKISSAEETGLLRLGRKYDFTMVSLTTQVKEAALAARAKAKKDADEKFMQDAEAMAKQVIAADEARRKAQAATLSDAPLSALADSTTPVPLPENAQEVKFDGDDGRLEFNATASVKALAAFYRGSLKQAGWKEQPSVINQPNMAVMEFAKAGKSISFTVMQMGANVNVSADGSGLVMAAAKPAPSKPSSSGKPTSSDPAGAQARVSGPLEADAESALPVPKQRTSTSLGTAKLPGIEAPFRRELEASVPAELGDVLAFYRSELTKLGWQEKPDGAAVAADRVQLAFASPQGPAVLKLGRANGETSVNLVQKNPEAATKADIMPKAGQAKLMLGNMGNQDAQLTINKQTVKVSAGAGGPQSPKGPMLDLPPGKYKYSLKVAGRPARSETIELAAGDAWGLMVGPTGEVLALQMY